MNMKHRTSKLVPNPDYVMAPYELSLCFHGRKPPEGILPAHRFARPPQGKEWTDPKRFAAFVEANSIPPTVLSPWRPREWKRIKV